MKIPDEITTFCPKCKMHTPHKVILYKAGKRRNLAQGQRRFLRKNEGYGSKRTAEQKRFAKVTKKQVIKLVCKKCGYTLHKTGIRLKKLEIVQIKG
ncbi:MAG: 50S ribosomal protein L44e [Thermoprotei archaeon]